MLKWQDTRQHDKYRHAKRPQVHLKAMTIKGMAVKYLGREVIGRAAEWKPFRLLVFELAGEAKVSYFDLHVFINKKIAQLDVPVYYVLGMYVL